MILVDTSIWIDFFNGSDSIFKRKLHQLIEEDDLCISDLILMEILQGIKLETDFQKVKEHLLSFPVFALKSTASYIKAANIYRECRKKGVTVRKSIDCIIAQTAIENKLLLFHNDKDFDLIASVIKDLHVLK